MKCNGKPFGALLTKKCGCNRCLIMRLRDNKIRRHMKRLEAIEARIDLVVSTSGTDISGKINELNKAKQTLIEQHEKEINERYYVDIDKD